jgi:hypothetical protein
VLLVGGLLLYCTAVWFDFLPWLRGWRDYPQGWTWKTYPAPPAERFIPALLTIAALWALVLTTEHVASSAWAKGRRRRGVVVLSYLVILVALGYSLQMSLLGLKSDNPDRLLVERVTDRLFSGFFSLAASANSPDAFFSRYPQAINGRVCHHCQTHPPGPALYYWLNIQAVSVLPPQWQADLASDTWARLGDSRKIRQARNSLSNPETVAALWGGRLLLLFASAVVVPLFGLARLLGPPGHEFRLAALGLTLPGLLLMTPEIDQVLALITAGALYLGLRGLMATSAFRSAFWSVAVGVVLSVGLFTSWAIAVLLPVLGALGLAAIALSRTALFPCHEGPQWFTALQWLAWVGGLAGGLLAPLALITITTGIDLNQILTANMKMQELGESQRPYLTWLFFGPVDFAQFLGLPLFVAALASVFPVGLRAGRRALRPFGNRINVYAAVFWLTYLGLVFSGRTKAEQGRLLVFLMPLALAAVYFWTSRAERTRHLIMMLFFAQMMVVLVMGARWMVP